MCVCVCVCVCVCRQRERQRERARERETDMYMLSAPLSWELFKLFLKKHSHTVIWRALLDWSLLRNSLYFFTHRHLTSFRAFLRTLISSGNLFYLYFFLHTAILRAFLRSLISSEKFLSFRILLRTRTLAKKKLVNFCTCLCSSLGRFQMRARR